jgi:hypothetical protein
MSIFDKIKNALFHRQAQAATAPAAAPAVPVQTAETSAVNQAAPSSIPAPAAAAPAGAAASPATAHAAAPTAPVTTTTASTPASAPVDVASIMDAAVKDSGQKLNWRTSIVDTMKALGLDSDLAARKELAHELNYTGDTADSATMNIWLQKALMKKLSENGGKVPAELMD